MRPRFYLPGFLLLIVSTAFAHNKSAELRQLEVNRQKWITHGIKSYEFRVRDETCFCMYAPYYGPLRVIVKNGKIAKAIYVGEKRDSYFPGREVHERTDLKATIDELFSRAQNVIKSSSDAPYKIRYDKNYGYPYCIDVRNPPYTADAQYRIVIDGFKPTQ